MGIGSALPTSTQPDASRSRQRDARDADVAGLFEAHSGDREAMPAAQPNGRTRIVTSDEAR